MKILRVIVLLICAFTSTLAAQEIEHPDGKAAEALAKELSVAAFSARSQYLSDLNHISSEIARLRYVSTLTEILYRYMSIEKGFAWDYLETGWKALSVELSRYPAPTNSDSTTLTKLFVGKWTSPRHDYLFRRNGTWTMLPIIDKDTTGGKWSIQGNQFFHLGEYYTIIMLNKNYFVYAEKVGAGVYSYRRTTK